MKVVKLLEEVSPEQGYTKEEIEAGIWNSPPAVKGQGRYRIVGQPIEKEDLKKVKAVYWDEEFLDEMDMWNYPTGWRITLDGIIALQSLGYTVEIETLEARRARYEKAKKEEAERERKKREEEAEREAKYRTAIAEFEKFLGSPSWRSQKEGEGHTAGQYVHTIRSENATIYNDEHVSYCLLDDGRVLSHRHYNADWWDNVTTSEPVTQEAQEFFQQKQKELDRKRAEERAEAERKAEEKKEKIKSALKSALERAGSWENLQRFMGKNKTFCPRELLDENGKPTRHFTVAEAKKIVEG